MARSEKRERCPCCGQALRAPGKHQAGKPKRCPRCGETKPRSEFYEHVNKRSQLSEASAWCKSCTREYQREHEREKAAGV